MNLIFEIEFHLKAQKELVILRDSMANPFVERAISIRGSLVFFSFYNSVVLSL